MHFAKGLCLIFLMGCCEMTFTVPVGHFASNSTLQRPTANTTTLTGTGTVTNAANAYDSDPATFAVVFSGIGAGNQAKVEYKTFPVFTTGGNTIFVKMDGTGNGGTIKLSTDGGTTFPYNFSLSSRIQGGMVVYDLQTVQISILDGLPSANIRVLVTCDPGSIPVGGEETTFNIYDIYIQ